MGSMKDLLGDVPLPEPEKKRAFDGKTYAPERDYVRLNGQMLRVYEAMQNGEWWTLAALVQKVGGSEAAVSARLRDLRKSKYGSRNIERKHVVSGLHQYRMASEQLANRP